MRISTILFGAAAVAIANVYYDNKLISTALANKKYLQMAAIASVAMLIYYLITHMPAYANKIIMSTHECLKHIPVYSSISKAVGNIKTVRGTEERSILSSAPVSAPVATTKRSVSETKKKYVASSQAWHCGECKQLLNHTFEIDHRIALINGGTNDTHNLVALCPMCHREKTARDIMAKF
jgi:5-methylcytosine-specific restriction endonuclease McrA